MDFDDFKDQKDNFLPRKYAKHLKNKHEFLTMDETEVIYVQNSSMYKPKGESFIKQKVEDLLPDSFKQPKKAKNDVLGSIRDSTRIEREDFKEDPRYINLKNGVYDVFDDCFFEDKSEFLFRHEVPVKYDADAEPDKILDFFYDIVNDEDVKLLQEIIGYCLYRDYPIAKAFMLLGEGANGKSTFLNVLEKFLGTENVASPSIHKLINDQFAKVELFGKLANINGDLDPDSLDSTGVFKRLTGGDTIRGRRMYQSSFKFQNYAKMIYSANELPNTKDDTDAFFRRWIILKFPYTFTSDEDDGNKDIDTNILDKICTEEEFSGLFNWAIKGLKRVLDRNEFTSTSSTENIKERWLMQSDSLKAFCELFVERDIDAMVTKQDFYRVYRKYCYKANLNFKNKHKIGHQLPNIMPVLQEKPTISGSQERVWKGMRFSEDLQLEDEDIVWYRDEGGVIVRESADDFVEDDVFSESDLLEVLPGEGEGMAVEMVFEEFPDVDNDKIGEVLDDLVRRGDVVEQISGFYKKV